jgi:hypothetical protein
VVERAGAALAAGLAPDSPEASPIVDDLVGLFADAAHKEDDRTDREELVWWLETFTEERVERYWSLIGIINGWPQGSSLTPVYRWFIEALRARA